jgi:hypothetical protein
MYSREWMAKLRRHEAAKKKKAADAQRKAKTVVRKTKRKVAGSAR